MIRKAWENEQPAGWFDTLYEKAAAGEIDVPWAYMSANPLMLDWLETTNLDGTGKRALVIGCGLGDDAEALAERGFAVTAFDISEQAIEWAKRRFPESDVRYEVHDLFTTPDDWQRRYNFVMESRTIQSLPHTLADQTMRQIADYVAPDGTLLVICHAREPHEPREGVPWSLSKDDLATFERLGLTQQELDEIEDPNWQYFRAVFRKRAV